MSKKQQVTLPNKVSQLIRIAITDIRKVEKMKSKYTINMNRWHVPDDNKVYDNFTRRWVKPKNIKNTCLVCLAGSVMACTFNSNSNKEQIPENFGAHNSEKLLQIDSIREGILEIDTNDEDRIEACEKASQLIRDYYNGDKGHAPWNIYLKAANILEEVGL